MLTRLPRLDYDAIPMEIWNRCANLVSRVRLVNDGAWAQLPPADNDLPQRAGASRGVRRQTVPGPHSVLAAVNENARARSSRLLAARTVVDRLPVPLITAQQPDESSHRVLAAHADRTAAIAALCAVVERVVDVL
jgi:hypothetical protein